MTESNEGIRIKVLKESEEDRRVTVTPEMYLEGRVWASQKWVKTDDLFKALAFTEGRIPDYKKPDKSLAYVFLDKKRKENILIGNGHHRTAAGIIENKPYEIAVGGSLGILPDKVLHDPILARQKLAVLGVEGVWPFKEFMNEFVRKKTDLRGK